MGYCSDSSEGSSTTENDACRWTREGSTKQSKSLAISIDVLPDDNLLEIFDFYVGIYDDMIDSRDTWQTLVHVCRRWRSIVFGSPRRLNLQLVCSTNTSTDMLDVWPALPLIIEDAYDQKEGFIALLEHSELVRRITYIELHQAHLEDISEAMEVPFPELTFLMLCRSRDEMEPVSLSDSFLGGSAPRLQILYLRRISFLGLPKLLSSATHLTDLELFDVPHSGYISPEAMVTCLSLLTSLGRLSLEFQSPQSRPDRERHHPPSSTRTVLPFLTHFKYKGDIEYLEDLVVRIDAPQLNFLNITFFNDIVFDTPRFTRLIGDTPSFNAFNEASFELGSTIAQIRLSLKASRDRGLTVKILCRELNWQFSFLEQFCTSSLSPFFTLEDLYIFENPYLLPIREDNIDGAVWEDNIDDAAWLELLHPFNTVKNLFLSEKIAPHVVSALQELVVGGRMTEVLPALQNVFIENLQPSGHVQEGVRKFVVARQVTSHPIVVFHWDRDNGSK